MGAVKYLPESMQRLWMFYCDLSSGNKSAIWLANGIIFGSLLGTSARIQKEADTKSDFLEVTEYQLGSKSRVKEFEKYWNDSAKRAQAQRGYEWTRMYKSVAWDDSPFHYLSIRMWEDKPVTDDIYSKRLEESKILAGGIPQRKEYVTVVDDSVVRTIS
jgi:hypothetical protein